MIIAFSNGTEILITTEDKREQFMDDFFGPNKGRDIKDYDEIQEPNFLRISSELDVRAYQK